MTLVLFNNLTDPDSNYRFIKGVFSMEDVFSGKTNTWRAMSSEGIFETGFAVIIILELMITLFLWVGSIGMLRHFRGEEKSYLKAKQSTTLGLGIGILLWFTVFITIGGEWFLMWQSQKWNGMPTAFSLTIVFFLFLMFHQQHDHD